MREQLIYSVKELFAICIGLGRGEHSWTLSLLPWRRYLGFLQQHLLHLIAHKILHLVILFLLLIGLVLLLG